MDWWFAGRRVMGVALGIIGGAALVALAVRAVVAIVHWTAESPGWLFLAISLWVIVLGIGYVVKNS